MMLAKIDIKNGNPNINDLGNQNNVFLIEIKKQLHQLRFDKKIDFSFLINLHKPDDVVKVPSKNNHYLFGQEQFVDEIDKLPIIHFIEKSFLPEFTQSDSLDDVCKFRYYNIIDSSIWNYLLCYSRKNNKPKIDADELKEILTSIGNNTSRKIYDLCVTHEYANLNARKTQQAYLIEDYGHGKFVSPFIFHSESKTKKTLEQESTTKIKNEISSQKWRILLIDDKAKESMSKTSGKWIKEEENNEGIWNNKIKVIKGLIAGFLGGDNFKVVTSDDEDITEASLLIEYAKDIEEAKKKLKAKKYDIILLDYLLKNSNKTEYGYELLNDLSTQEGREGIIEKNTYEKLFIMFISAYTSAIYERLQAENLNQDEDYWYISLGACPINTPQLFLYNLIKLMERRLNQSRIKELSLSSIVDNLTKIFTKTESTQSKNVNVRLNANKRYFDILSLQYYYRQILSNVALPDIDDIFSTPKYVLMTNFIKKNPHLGGLLEHLAELIHLIGFGTVRQWPEMWEEYIYVKAQLETRINTLERKEVKELCDKIEEYILKIKSSAL